ncbi:hypothetical protein JNK13_03890 [bacterium]|nr:hypothetical protein [bacterium]
MWESGKNYHFDIGWRGYNTVFVLGAGASYHLGYPLGNQLSDNILNNTRDPSSDSFKMLEGMGFSGDEIKTFHEQFRKTVAPTIDEFLSRREEFVKIARAAIAQELIKYEEPNLLQRRSDNWYLLLRTKIIEAIEQNQYGPVFVTFNYDRSIDKFLTDLIFSNFPKRAESLIDTTQVLHVHGRLGYLDTDKQNGFKREYSSNATAEQILQSSEGIRVISELEHDYGKEMQVAQAVIAKAKKVIFLGFGYDDTNLDRLRINGFDRNKPWDGEDKYYGTAFKLDPKRIEELRKESEGRIFLGKAQTVIPDFLGELGW